MLLRSLKCIRLMESVHGRDCTCDRLDEQSATVRLPALLRIDLRYEFDLPAPGVATRPPTVTTGVPAVEGERELPSVASKRT